jgi:hypothetical protein
VQSIDADLSTDHHRASALTHHLCRNGQCWLAEKAMGRCLLCEKQLHLALQRHVFRARLAQECHALTNVARQRRVIQPLDLRPAIRCHESPPASERRRVSRAIDLAYAAGANQRVDVVHTKAPPDHRHLATDSICDRVTYRTALIAAASPSS